MKRISLLILLLFIPAVTTLSAQEKTKVLQNSREADADYQLQREEWIRQMHRAAPDVDPQQMDITTRDAKYKAFQLLIHKHSSFPLSVPLDTIAGGSLSGSWIERGSNNVSGRMITEDIDFGTNTIYAASAMGNIWKASLDNTNQWTSLNDNHRFGDVRMLRVITTSKGKRIIAVANGPSAVNYSDDGGITWLAASGLSGPKNWGGFKRAVITGNEQTIYLFGNEWDYNHSYAVATLYRSTDQGKTFTNLGKWQESTDHCDIWAAHNTASSTYFLKGDSLFHLPASGAMGFVAKMTYSTDIANVGNMHIQGAETKNVTTLAILETTNSVGTITESTNGGTSWATTGTFNGDLFNDNSFKILNSDPKTMAIGTNEAFISQDNGATWNHINGWGEYYGDETTKLHADIDGIDFIQDQAGNEVQLISTDGGIFMSRDTLNSFTNITLSGIGSSQYYSVLTSRQAPYFIYGGSQDQGYQRTEDSVTGSIGMKQTISGDYGHLSSSNNGISTWCDYPGFAMLYTNAQGPIYDRGWTFQGSNHLWMPPVTADPQNPQAAYITCGGDAAQSYIWHLVNGKDSISATHWSFDFSQDVSSRTASAIEFSSLDHSRAYVSTNDGKFFYSMNTGGSWTESAFNSAPASHYFYGSVILPSTKNSNTLWIAGSGYSNPGVFLSTDNGASFSPIDSGLPKTMIYGLAATDDEKFLFAATDVGPYVYNVSTGIWYDMSDGHAPDMVYWSVDYIPAIKTVRFGTYGRGIWDFVIGGAPTPHSYTITTPKAGDVITGATANYSIKYTSINPGTQKTFEFSLDGGGTWSALNGTAGATSFTWAQVPDTAATQAMIRISDELGTLGRSGIFTITKKPIPGLILTLTIGVTNSQIANGANMSIHWTTNGGDFGTGFTAEYSADGGTSWKLVKSVGAAIRQTSWTTPQGYYPNSYIRVRGTDADKVNIIQQSGEFAIGNPAGVNENSAYDLQVWNYPNPFSQSTTFKYSLPGKGLVNLIIFDVTGREVSNIILNKEQEAGIYMVNFDASSLASGSYTYILTSEAKKVVGTMTIVK